MTTVPDGEERLRVIAPDGVSSRERNGVGIAAATVACIVTAAVTDTFAGVILSIGCAVGLTFALGRPRLATVSAANGELRLSGRITSIYLKSKFLSGFTTAALPSGKVSACLAFTEGQSQRRYFLEGTPAQIENIRILLGIRHDGMGTMPIAHRPMWARAGEPIGLATLIAQLVSFVVLSVAFHKTLPQVAAERALAIWGGALLFAIARARTAPIPALYEGGLLAERSASGNRWIPYTDIRGAFVIGTEAASVVGLSMIDGTTVSLRTGSLSGLEAMHAVAQINAAAQRARGDGGLPVTFDDVARIFALDSSPQEWRIRIDAQATGSSPGYRALNVAPELARDILSSPDAPLLMRAGAARLLLRIGDPEAKARLQVARDSLRDDHLASALEQASQEDTDDAIKALASTDRSRNRT